MKKPFVSLILVLAIVTTVIFSPQAFSKNEHNDYLRKVLFGNNTPLNKEALDVIFSASYLTLDQYNGSGQKELDALHSFGVGGLPDSISKIDFNSNFSHRSHTHRGWDYTFYFGYSAGNDKAHWRIRKNILLETVSKVFSFKRISIPWLGIDNGFDKQVTGFAALVYYTHLIGDHLYDYENQLEKKSSGEDSGMTMPLMHSNPSESNPDILFEVQNSLKVLFDTSDNNNSYRDLSQSLSLLRSKANASVSIDAGLSSNAYADELLQILILRVPPMMKKTDFFKRVFF